MQRPRSIPPKVRAGCLLLFSFFSAAQISTLSAQVVFIQDGADQIAVRINGRPVSEFYYGPAYPKPFLAPLRTASGITITRKYPMETVDGESRDHQHHRGVWIGYGDINGINFWENEFSYSSNAPKNFDPAKNGRIVLQHLNNVTPGRQTGSIDATFRWQSPTGAEFLEERRVIAFYALDPQAPERQILDFDVTLTAKRPVHFADTKEGFFAIRLADGMTEKAGGVMTSSEGAHTEGEVWGKRANWVDYNGTIEGSRVGVAIFDHPGNLNHPTRWHSRAYGLFAANPFGTKDFDPSGHAGGYSMKTGQSLRFRYRVLIHSGDLPQKAVEREYADYSKP